FAGRGVVQPSVVEDSVFSVLGGLTLAAQAIKDFAQGLSLLPFAAPDCAHDDRQRARSCYRERQVVVQAFEQNRLALDGIKHHNPQIGLRLEVVLSNDLPEEWQEIEAFEERNQAWLAAAKHALVERGDLSEENVENLVGAVAVRVKNSHDGTD